MWIIKKDTFTPLCNKLKSYKEFLFLRVIIALVFIPLFLTGICSCGRQEVTETTPLRNSPPRIASVKILPENPDKESVFNLVIECYDADYDRVVYRFQWIKNDEEIIGEDKEIFRDAHLKKGDVIRVKVTPSDGKADGETFLSSPVKIINSPPVIEEVRIEPEIAYANGDLKAFVKSFDADGDSVNFNYKWEKNRIVLSEENTDVLAQGRFKRGDSIAVTVVPDDGEILGVPKKSKPIMIVNSPPIITSSPPNKTNGNVYTYQVIGNDPDNDPIIFALKNAPKGMEVDAKTGLIRWEIHNEDQGTQSIEIEASDSEGAKSFQRYTLSVKFR
jgi:hypothetical protein